MDVVVFDAYNLPNEALNNGEIDLNSFQHKAYLENECKAQGYDLTAIGDTSSAPLTLYSKKVDSLKALKEYGVKVKVLTGDNDKVARSICKQVGLKVNNLFYDIPNTFLLSIVH